MFTFQHRNSNLCGVGAVIPLSGLFKLRMESGARPHLEITYPSHPASALCLEDLRSTLFNMLNNNIDFKHLDSLKDIIIKVGNKTDNKKQPLLWRCYTLSKEVISNSLELYISF